MNDDMPMDGPLDTRLTGINQRWGLYLPRHRADRPEWPWWEAQRLAAMRYVVDRVHADKTGRPVVWDVGAEEGDLPALWASWGCDVVLAEPNPRVWPNIKRIFDANRLGERLAGCWVGFLSDVDGPVNDGATDEWPPCTAGPVIGDHGFLQLGERPDVPQVSIDKLVSVHRFPRPDIITMDVEGAELHVLKGAHGTLRKHQPHVLVSIHPEFMAHHYGIQEGVGAVRTEMVAAGYPHDTHRFLCIDHEHHWWFPPAGFEL